MELSRTLLQLFIVLVILDFYNSYVFFILPSSQVGSQIRFRVGSEPLYGKVSANVGISDETNSSDETLATHSVAAPMIHSKHQMFGHPYTSTTDTAMTYVTSQAKSDLPFGLQRFSPSDIRYLETSVNEENGSDDATDVDNEVIEEVDKFRFVINPADLRRAIESNSSIQTKQINENDIDALSVSVKDSPSPTMVLDSSIVSLLNTQTAELEDGKVVYRLDLDFDHFKENIKMHGHNDTIASISDGENASSKNFTKFDIQKMQDVEATVRGGDTEKLKSAYGHDQKKKMDREIRRKESAEGDVGSTLSGNIVSKVVLGLCSFPIFSMEFAEDVLGIVTVFLATVSALQIQDVGFPWAFDWCGALFGYVSEKLRLHIGAIPWGKSIVASVLGTIKKAYFRVMGDQLASVIPGTKGAVAVTPPVSVLNKIRNVVWMYLVMAVAAVYQYALLPWREKTKYEWIRTSTYSSPSDGSNR